MFTRVPKSEKSKRRICPWNTAVWERSRPGLNLHNFSTKWEVVHSGPENPSGNLVFSYEKTVWWGHVSGGSMTTTFYITTPTAGIFLPHLNDKNLCNSCAQNMPYMLSTLYTFHFPHWKALNTWFVNRTISNRKNTTESVPTNVLIFKIIKIWFKTECEISRWFTLCKVMLMSPPENCPQDRGCRFELTDSTQNFTQTIK